jgi:PadR family transcriptional regulator, regulatory protein PadR
MSPLFSPKETIASTLIAAEQGFARDCGAIDNLSQSVYEINMESISGDHLRGHLETMILSVLERGDAHGMEIIRRLEAAGCGLLRLKEGSLYPALYRLEADRLVVGAVVKDPTGQRGPRPRNYRLTAKGQRALNRGRAEWRQFVSIIGGIVGGTA